MRVLVSLAVSGLLHRKVSLALMLLAVAVGVGFQIPNAANINGYTHELQRKGISRDIGHVLVSPQDEQWLSRSSARLFKLEKLPFVRGVTTRVSQPGVIFSGKQQVGVRVVGVDVKRENRINGLCKRVAKGNCLKNDTSVLLGRRLADRLNITAGSQIRLVIPHKADREFSLVQRVFVVSGVLAGGGGFQADWDVLVSLKLLSRVLGLVDKATQLAVYVDDAARAPLYAKHIESLLPDARARPWQQVEAFVSRAIEANQQLARISMAMVVAAVMIPILALLYIHVLQQRREIAVLAALGFSQLDLFFIYLFKAGIIGFIGVGIGLGIGFGLISYFDAHPLFEWSGFVVRPVPTIRTILVPSLVLWSATLIAGLAPAFQAARSNPSATLRKD